MLVINEEQILDEAKKDEKEQEAPIDERDFTWESLASVEISRQNQLISEVYQLMSSGDSDRIEFIKKEWDLLSEGIEPSLQSRFDEALEKYENRFENISKAQSIKKDLIKRAKDLQDSSAWSKTAQELQKLQEEWKAAGFAGRDIDQELWEEFSLAKRHFYARRKENYEKMRENHVSAAEIKKTLILRAEALQDSTAWKETSDEMQVLMDEWKAAGFAGRELDQELWERFNEARQVFFAAQRSHYEELRSMYAQARSAKEALLDQAEQLSKLPAVEETRLKFTALFDEWKELGSAGRKHEQKLWEKFKAYQDEFYQKLKSNRRRQNAEKYELASEDIERLEVRIQALQQLNEMIDIKLESLKNNSGEDNADEISELEQNKRDNETKLAEYNRELNQLKRYV